MLNQDKLENLQVNSSPNASIFDALLINERFLHQAKNVSLKNQQFSLSSHH
jgi:hypothetical protein